MPISWYKYFMTLFGNILHGGAFRRELQIGVQRLTPKQLLKATHHWHRRQFRHSHVTPHPEWDYESDAGHYGDRVPRRVDAGQFRFDVFVYVSQRRSFVVVHGHWRFVSPVAPSSTSAASTIHLFVCTPRHVEILEPRPERRGRRVCLLERCLLWIFSSAESEFNTQCHLQSFRDNVRRRSRRRRKKKEALHSCWSLINTQVRHFHPIFPSPRTLGNEYESSSSSAAHSRQDDDEKRAEDDERWWWWGLKCALLDVTATIILSASENHETMKRHASVARSERERERHSL